MINPFNYIKQTAELEFTYIDNNNERYSFNSQVLEILPDKIKMSKPINKLDDFNMINAYDKLQIKIFTDDGAFSCDTNFLDFTDDTYTDIYISYLYNCNFVQQRNSKRIPLHIDSELNILNSGNGVLDTVYFKTKDISETGTACITKEPLPDFNNARLTLHLENIDIIAFCEKVYSKEMELNEEILFLNGIKFTNISTHDITIIMKEMLKFQYGYQTNELMIENL
ncbi:MAG: PilZ domain-containing protein [Candidatus Gastranaerophilales bacterium]|nr:PilZ domain-containing protein [Candidatus Gastranaerophilales bacterium]